MARAKIYLETKGMRQMQQDFSDENVGSGLRAAHERLDDVAQVGQDFLTAAIPVGTDAHDDRRYRGALRDSARHTTAVTGDDWSVVYEVGTNSDEVPYAKWVLYKNIKKPDGDYLEPVDEFLDEAGPRAMDTAFDAMFGEN